MPLFLEKSAGVIIFRPDQGSIKYLLLHYPSATHRSKKDYWDFTKGHVEKGELELEAAKREAVEETGINDLVFAEGFYSTMKYFFRYKLKLIFKVVSFRLAQTNSETVTLSGEHDDFIWLPYEDAYKMLSFANARQVIAKANDFLIKNNVIQQ